MVVRMRAVTSVRDARPLYLAEYMAMAALSVLLLTIGSLSTVLSDAGPQGPIVPGVRVVQDVFSTELVEALIKVSPCSG